MLPPRFFAIVPAAGRSQRMGRPKLLLPWRGKTIIEHVLSAWKASRVTSVVVVVHPDDRSLAERCLAAGVDVVIAPIPPPDMKASIRLGLDRLRNTHAPAAQDRWLVAPADMPRLSSTAMDAVMAAHATNESRIIVPMHAGRRGHPVMFPWPLAADVDQLSAEEGLNTLVSRHPAFELSLDDPTILADVDTPDDYRELNES